MMFVQLFLFLEPLKSQMKFDWPIKCPLSRIKENKHSLFKTLIQQINKLASILERLKRFPSLLEL